MRNGGHYAEPLTYDPGRPPAGRPVEVGQGRGCARRGASVSSEACHHTRSNCGLNRGNGGSPCPRRVSRGGVPDGKRLLEVPTAGPVSYHRCPGLQGLVPEEAKLYPQMHTLEWYVYYAHRVMGSLRRLAFPCTKLMSNSTALTRNTTERSSGGTENADIHHGRADARKVQDVVPGN